MRIFFDVDGVLIDGRHANSALRKLWGATRRAARMAGNGYLPVRAISEKSETDGSA